MPTKTALSLLIGIVVGALTTAGVLITVERLNADKPAEKPEGAKEPTWSDYTTEEAIKKDFQGDDLKIMLDRWNRRPGDIDMLTALGTYLEGELAVKPSMTRAAYPFIEDGGKVYATEAEWHAAIDKYSRKRPDGSRVNRARDTLINISFVSFHAVDGTTAMGAPLAEKQKRKADRLIAAGRKAHPTGSLVLAMTGVWFESLDSTKGDAGASGAEESQPHAYLLLKTKEGWRVVGREH